MTAFSDYYLPSVEKELGWSPSKELAEKIKILYVAGWHPTRTAEYLRNICEYRDCVKERSCLYYCEDHHKEICMGNNE